jgi:zinc protease
VRKALDEELKTFSQSGPTEKELKQISSALEREVLTSFQDLRSRADKMNEYQYFWGEPNSFKRDIERVKAVTRENVRKTASEVFSKHRVEITVIPTDTPNRKDRDEKPTIDKEPDFAAPTSQDFTLSNGISVTYFRQDDLPLTEISVAVGYGSHHDPRNKAGLAALLGEMLTAGTGTLDAKAYQEQLDLLGASVSVNTSPTQTLINLSALTSNLDESINLFASALTKPAFLEKEFNRIKDLSIQSIKADLEEPTAIASIVAAKYYFGDQHPAGVPASGTLSTLKGIQLEDLKKAYAIAFNSGNAKIFAAGNLSADELKVKLEKALGTWNKGTALPKLTYSKLEQKPLTVLLVDVPDAPQTVIRFRFPGVTYTDPDRQAIEAIGTLFGGTFTSRLNANLREDKGYTYGAGARSSSTLYYGTFEANASVREDATGASLKEFLAEFNKLQQGDITDEETEKAISSKKADIVSVFGTLSGIVSAAQEMATYGKTVKDLVAERNQLSTLNTAKLNALVKKALQSNYGVLVLVGDKEKILPQLEGLNLPKPIEVDLEKD